MSAGAQAPPALGHVLETVLYVDDLDRAAWFYGEVLGLEEASRRPGLFLFYRLDRAMLLLFRADAARHSTSVPPHGADGAGHLALACPDDGLDAWRLRLEAAGIAIEHEARWPGGGRSLYVRDPADNSVELAAPSIWGFADGADAAAP